MLNWNCELIIINALSVFGFKTERRRPKGVGTGRSIQAHARRCLEQHPSTVGQHEKVRRSVGIRSDGSHTQSQSSRLTFQLRKHFGEDTTIRKSRRAFFASHQSQSEQRIVLFKFR